MVEHRLTASQTKAKSQHMAKQPKGELVVFSEGFDYARLEAEVAERVAYESTKECHSSCSRMHGGQNR
jgi:hypothetical protein